MNRIFLDINKKKSKIDSVIQYFYLDYLIFLDDN